ncbi:MAG: hypothetical protein KKF33_19350 [Alphaproteobacteria bacterium]|nr:hypothetical protein [Alphaproteobacteria bacterium]
MTARGPDDATDWVAIRRAYELTDEPVRLIRERFGVTKAALEHRRSRGRWVGRRLRKVGRGGTALDWLFAVLVRQIVKLANADGDTLGDKEAQQLNDLIKAADKMITMAGATTAEDKADKPRPPRDPEALREKLVKRIEQFHRR